jgi:hypothetical protein
MKDKTPVFLCLIFLSSGVWAQSGAEAPAPAPRYHRYYYALGGGAAVPFGGHWGDGGVGFKASAAITLSGARKVDDTLSYGLEASYAPCHKNQGIRDMKLRVLSLTPFLRAAYLDEGKTFYALLGAGIYHWTQPSLAAGGAEAASDSGSSPGFNIGGGILYPFRGDLQLGLDLRWHHIFSIRGDNLDTGAADNLVPSVLFTYGF